MRKRFALSAAMAAALSMATAPAIMAEDDPEVMLTEEGTCPYCLDVLDSKDFGVVPMGELVAGEPISYWAQKADEWFLSMPFEEHRGRSIADLAEAKGVAPGDFALDLALADDFETSLRWRMDGPEWSDAVRKSQVDPRILIGTSDGGAHLAKDDQSDWSSYFLGTWVRDRKVWTLEEGVRRITTHS